MLILEKRLKILEKYKQNKFQEMRRKKIREEISKIKKVI